MAEPVKADLKVWEIGASLLFAIAFVGLAFVLYSLGMSQVCSYEVSLNGDSTFIWDGALIIQNDTHTAVSATQFGSNLTDSNIYNYTTDIGAARMTTRNSTAVVRGQMLCWQAANVLKGIGYG